MGYLNGRMSYTQNTPGATVAVQLPAPLVVTSYTLRNDVTGRHPLRTWVLEGSNTGKDGSWVVLKTHANDTALAATKEHGGEMSVASWNVHPDVCGGRAFVHFLSLIHI